MIFGNGPVIGSFNSATIEDCYVLYDGELLPCPAQTVAVIGSINDYDLDNYRMVIESVVDTPLQFEDGNIYNTQEFKRLKIIYDVNHSGERLFDIPVYKQVLSDLAVDAIGIVPVGRGGTGFGSLIWSNIPHQQWVINKKHVYRVGSMAFISLSVTFNQSVNVRVINIINLPSAARPHLVTNSQIPLNCRMYRPGGTATAIAYIRMIEGEPYICVEEPSQWGGLGFISGDLYEITGMFTVE